MKNVIVIFIMLSVFFGFKVFLLSAEAQEMSYIPSDNLKLALVSAGHDIKQYNSEQIIASEERQNIVSSMTVFTCTGILIFFGFMCYVFLRRGIAQIINNLFVSDQKLERLENKVNVVFNAVQDARSLGQLKDDFIDIEKLKFINKLPKKQDNQVMLSYNPGDQIDGIICLILEVQDDRAISIFTNSHGNPFFHNLEPKGSKDLIENKEVLIGNIKTFLSSESNSSDNLVHQAIHDGKFFRFKK